MKKLSISSITDLVTTRSVNARVYINFWFVVENDCILTSAMHTPVANPNKVIAKTMQEWYPNTTIQQIPVAIIPEFVGSVTYGG